MTTRLPRRAALLVAVALGLGVVPAGAATPSNVGSPTRYGLSKGFQLVGRTTLGDRGVNSPIAVAGQCVYVGDRYDKHGIAVVDVKDPRRPRQVATIKPDAGSTQRELRADRGLGLLVVMQYSTRGIGDTAGNYLRTYDIRDCRHPRLLATVDFGARSPHEFFLWKDPKHAGRALAYVTFTLFTPDLAVYDLSDPTAPQLASVYDIAADQAFKAQDAATKSGSGYLHSLAVSDDGTRAYMGNWDYGFYVADTSSLADPPVAGLGAVRPAGLPLDYGHNVHGGVKVPGRPYVVMVQEEYANAGSGCPFGWVRTADISDETQPELLGEFRIPENDCARAKQLNGTFTAHNQTVFPHVALVPWYSGGLRAVDIHDPAHLSEAGAFVPRSYFEPDQRDSRLYFPGNGQDKWNGAMWSYPVVQDGLIYVVDIDLGLFVLRYTGRYAGEVAKAGFVEGNSAPSRFTRSAPGTHRTAAAQAAVERVLRSGPRTVPAGLGPVTWRGHAFPHGFLCV